jgi:hypothetical protein
VVQEPHDILAVGKEVVEMARAGDDLNTDDCQHGDSESLVVTALYVYDRCYCDRANVATIADPERQVVKQCSREERPVLTGPG